MTTKANTMRYLFAAVWISVSLLGCDARFPVVGEDVNGDRRTGEEGMQPEEGDQQPEDGDNQNGDGDDQNRDGDDQNRDGDDQNGGGEQRTEEGDRAQLMEMRQGIDALVGDAVASSISDCRYAALGSKPCGGPWEYIIYSVSFTDSTALVMRLTAYDAFEAEMNERYGLVSDCSVPNIPVLAFTDGRCIAE